MSACMMIVRADIVIGSPCIRVSRGSWPRSDAPGSVRFEEAVPMDMLLASDRNAVRRAVTVECQVVREKGFVLLGERAADLSTGGMLLLSNKRVSVGEEVIVTFRVPGTDRWVDTCATVARVVHGRRRGDPGAAVGLLFDPLESDDNRVVRWALRRIPPKFPARPLRVDYAGTAAMIALA
jgi:hypothetical protein